MINLTLKKWKILIDITKEKKIRRIICFKIQNLIK